MSFCYAKKNAKFFKVSLYLSLSLSTKQFHQTSYFRKVVVYPSNVIAEMRHGITFAGDLAFYKKAAVAAVPSSHDDEAIERASCKG